MKSVEIENGKLKMENEECRNGKDVLTCVDIVEVLELCSGIYSLTQ